MLQFLLNSSYKMLLEVSSYDYIWNCFSVFVLKWFLSIETVHWLLFDISDK